MNTQDKVNLYRRLLRKAKAELRQARTLEDYALGIASAIDVLLDRATTQLQTGAGREEAALVALEGVLKKAHDQMVLAYEVVAGL